MNKLIMMILTAVATIVAAESFGQTCPGGYACQQPAAYGPGRVALYHPVYRVPAPTYYVTAPAPVAVAMTPAATVPTQPAGGGYGAALAMVNGLRAQYGLAPLAWSSNLAAYAATNTGIHTPHSMGGASQVWAGVHDPVQAVRMWFGSQAHLNILLAARSEIGISACSTGMTANAR